MILDPEFDTNLQIIDIISITHIINIRGIITIRDIIMYLLMLCFVYQSLCCLCPRLCPGSNKTSLIQVIDITGIMHICIKLVSCAYLLLPSLPGSRS